MVEGTAGMVRVVKKVMFEGGRTVEKMLVVMVESSVIVKENRGGDVVELLSGNG